MKKYDKNPIEKKKDKSVTIVAVILLIIFLALLSCLLYLKFNNSFNIKNFAPNKISLNESLNKQLENQKGEKIVQIRLTDEELAKVLNTNAKDFPLQNTAVAINTSNIILTGKTGSGPFSFKVSVGIVPKVNSQGKIDFEVKEIKTAGVTAPKLVTDQVNDRLSSYLKQFTLQEDIKVTEVKLYDGYLTVTGERNI